MRSKITIGAFALAIVAVATVWAFAAGKEKGPTLTPVTVALQGVQCSSCSAKLQQELTAITGVTEAKATVTQVTASLDEGKISASRFAQTVATKLAKIEPGANVGARLVAYIDAGMCAGQKKMCPACFTEIPKVLKTVKGVKAVTLDETGKVATITFVKDAKVTTTTLAQALKKSSFGFAIQFTAPDAKARTQSSGGGACH